ncbi:MAG: tetratricopeptide repeat protein [Alphaproteobacteria bacterium]|nr:tetratricopeptide repeat protein [Alphaproteobacteria bacterium]
MSNEAWLKAEIGFTQYLIQAGRLDAARDSLAALEGPEPVGPIADAWKELGGAYFSQDRHREAEAAFRRALDKFPADDEARMGLGYALFNQTRTSEAENCFKQVAQSAGGNAVAWRALCATRLNLHDHEGAAKAIARALALNGKDAETHALRGLLAYRKSQAGRRWRDWTRQNLKDPAARPNLLAGVMDQRELDDSLRSIQDARQIDPRIRTDELGARLLVAMGRPEEALEFLAASPQPDARSWQLTADVCWLLRQEDEARIYLKKSLEARMFPEPEPRPLEEETLCQARVAAGLNRHKHESPSATPLVWVHWDAPAYFSQSIGSALAASPSTPLVILGDSTNAFSPCQHMPLSRRAASAWAFLERYRHASENDFVYEAFCLMRWFFLQDWSCVAGVERLAAVDSDLLLYCDVERELVPRMKGLDLAFTGEMGPHLALLTSQGLSDLCGFFMDAYANGAPSIGCQVSDMLLLPHFLKTRRWADLSQIETGCRVDMNMRLSEGFCMAGEIKQVSFRQGQAFAKNRETGLETRLLALHFQGPAKPYMGQALRQEDFTV